MSDSLMMIGCGGHASVLMDILLDQDRKVEAYISPSKAAKGTVFEGLVWISNDDLALAKDADSIKLVNGIGSLPGDDKRATIFELYKSKGFQFASVVASGARVSTRAILSEGSQVMPAVVVNIGAEIGPNTIVNSGAVIEHDCIVGRNCHIAPNATLCGQVTLGDSVHIGVGASVIQNTVIGKGVTVGIGSIVTKDIADYLVCYGSRSSVNNQQDVKNES